MLRGITESRFRAGALGNNFFVEQTDLKWSEDGGKRIALHHALPDGAVVFVRLLTLDCEIASVPLTYQA